jgi:two-component system, chemotaxis family, sensor kinase CheA
MTTQDPTDIFRQEARELLDQLEQALLDLEQSPDDRDLVDSSFRALHTLKGSGAMFGFDEVAEFVHDFETAFDQVRKGKAEIGAGLVMVALSAKDHVAKLIAQPGMHAAEGAPILKALRQIVEAGQASAVAPHPLAAISAVEQKTRPADATTWHVRFHLPEDALVVGANPVLLLDELRALGPCTVTALSDAVPPLEDIDPEVAYLGWDVLLETDSGREAIEDVFIFLKDGMDLLIEPVLAAETPAPAAFADTSADHGGQAQGAPANGQHIRPSKGQQGGAVSGEKAASSLRVPAERLDELMDRVGELVIAQARLFQIAAASEDLNLKAVAEEIERLSSGLRDTTMGIRMVPIGSLFGRFRRLVHDLSGELGKPVDFITSGEETELDKTMIERLADPLVHIIRNAVDHGLETPDKRSRTSKLPKGTVKLAAIHTGAEVAITISDDGAGLDAERIRAKAIEQGLIGADAKLTDQELFPLIFHPGFSTAKEVTSLSGRGVGMDVVKRTIDALRGTIDINSAAGQGTTVTLRLPLTLAIIDGMLVRVGKGRYSIPLSAVEECVELSAAEADAAKGRNFLNIRGNLVPFLRLRELFGTKAPADLHQKVVIVSAGENRVGLVVDQIIGNNQTVIKSLSKLHADVETFSGATILGDGTVALILDVNHLVSFGQSFEERLRNGRAA